MLVILASLRLQKSLCCQDCLLWVLLTFFAGFSVKVMLIKMKITHFSIPFWSFLKKKEKNSLFSFYQISSFVLLCLLFSQCWSGGVGSLGHSRSGGLWQTETSLLSRHWRHPHVFLHRQPWQLGCVQSKHILAVTYIHDLNKTNCLFCVCHISDFNRRYFWTVLIVHFAEELLTFVCTQSNKSFVM